MSVEILSVVDTREFEKIGERWVPIRDTGTPHECARCARMHEVHATVRYADGSTAVVGTGCMGVEAGIARKAASRATTLAKLRAGLRHAEATHAANQAAWIAVRALSVPAEVCGELTLSSGAVVPTLAIGEVVVWCTYVKTADDRAERVRFAVGQWRANRAEELHPGASRPDIAECAVDDLRRRIRRAGG